MKLEVKRPEQSNYSAKVVRLKNLRKHANADRLQCATIDFQNVITGLDAQDGDYYVYFPVECAINADFLRITNSFREKERNADPMKVGFFEVNCRVRAITLRGEKSMGYIVPIHEIEKWLGLKKDELVAHENVEFDTINGIDICQKYIIKTKQTNDQSTKKHGPKPKKVSRLVENQVRLHIDTENLRKNAFKINPDDVISVSYKVHGTSWFCTNVLAKKKLSWWEQILLKARIPIKDVHHDHIYGSRRVVKNANMYADPKKEITHFYGHDLWEDIKNEIKDRIPKGFSLYGECVGFLKNGKAIQKDYHYGCSPGTYKIVVYRITFTNEDGYVTELLTPAIREFCTHYGLETVHQFYYGKASGMYPHLNVDEHWHEEWIKQLERDYNDKDCFLCTDKAVPEEGIVIRKESIFGFDAFKLKSFRFLKKESEELDTGEVNIEDNVDDEELADV